MFTSKVSDMIMVMRRIGVRRLIKETIRAIRVLGLRRVLIANIESYKVSKALASNGWSFDDAVSVAMMAGMAAANGEKTVVVFGGSGGLLQKTIIREVPHAKILEKL